MRYALLILVSTLLVVGCADSKVAQEPESEGITKTEWGETVTQLDTWHWRVESEQAAAELSPDEFVQVDEQPELKDRPQPGYPERARKGDKQGSVWVKALVNQRGKVEEALILRDSGYNVGFEESALEAAINTTWEPALLDGEPVATWVAYEVSFKLRDQ